MLATSHLQYGPVYSPNTFSRIKILCCVCLCASSFSFHVIVISLRFQWGYRGKSQFLYKFFCEGAKELSRYQSDSLFCLCVGLHSSNISYWFGSQELNEKIDAVAFATAATLWSVCVRSTTALFLCWFLLSVALLTTLDTLSNESSVHYLTSE